MFVNVKKNTNITIRFDFDPLAHHKTKKNSFTYDLFCTVLTQPVGHNTTFSSSCCAQLPRLPLVTMAS